MIHLKDLNEQQLNPFKTNIEHCPILMWKKTNFLRKLHTNILAEVGKKYNEELWVILTHAAKCVRYNTKGFNLSFNKNHYTSANKEYKHKLNADRMKELIITLEEKGYVVYCKGFFFNPENYARSVIILKSLNTLIDKKQADTQALSREELLNNVEVKDTEKSVVKRIKGKKVQTVAFKPTRNIRGIKEYREFVQSWNKMLEKNVITINGEVENCIIVKQRFEDDLTKCGRYFLGDFQTQRSALRKTITINGNEVCEVDYKNCQPRMLAAMNGVDLPKDFDAYAIDGLDRDFAKSLLFPVLFSCSRKDAKTSITGKLKEAKITHINSEEVLQKFEAHNAYMKDFFYNKKLYQQLQNNDSRMLRYIVEHFLAKDVCVLGYHDSVVVESQYCEELQQVMVEAWKHVLGTEASCKPNVEFCNTSKSYVSEPQTAGIEHTLVLPPLEVYNDIQERMEAFKANVDKKVSKDISREYIELDTEVMFADDLF